jgi:hypothetical protein
MSTGRVTGRNNHAGDLAPLVSPWGQALFRDTTHLIDQAPPIGRQWNDFQWGTVGGLTTRSANVKALFTEEGYYGDLPQSQQPTVEAADPWNRG